MKKLILSMVFVFAFVVATPTSASNTINDNMDIINPPADCVAAAFFYQSYLESLGMDSESANAAADFVYTLCIINNK